MTVEEHVANINSRFRDYAAAAEAFAKEHPDQSMGLTWRLYCNRNPWTREFKDDCLIDPDWLGKKVAEEIDPEAFKAMRRAVEQNAAHMRKLQDEIAKELQAKFGPSLKVEFFDVQPDDPEEADTPAVVERKP